ncbi:MAG TPA: hypothetical protein VGQ90_05360 [Stellaceae bacterium]|jgi:hypothetical protein|nr:hypothetical protein [Stellaceae bacterium]
MRMYGRAAGAAALLLWLVQPAAADGLAKFEKAIKEQPPGELTYKNAKALGDNGFVLEDVVIKPPEDAVGAKTEPVAIKRVTVEDFDFAGVEKNAPPAFARVRVEGIAISGKPAEGIDLAKLAGIDKITADFKLDYRLDPDKKTMTLKQLEIDLNGLARLDFAIVIEGVSAESVEKPDAAMNDATLRSASLVFEDRSLLGKVLPAAAKMQDIDPAALIGMAKMMLGGLRDGQGPATLAVLDAIGSFIEDYRAPKGPLKLALDPPGKTTAAAVMGMQTPDEAFKALGLKVSYAGSRPQAPAAKPAADKPAK